MSKHVVMVAAVARNGVIGHEGDIPWSISEDLKHFRAVTKGHTVVMGRKTFDSIGHPLPFRTNIVVTRDPEWSHDNVFTATSLEEAVEVASGHTGDTVIMGGAQIYAQALPLATHQILTEVDLEPEGDTFYPVFEAEEWVETRREEYAGDPAYAFVWLSRR
ncbi:dihydrofolate reductase [Nocardioides jejuensis]|uniref:Dihydrofolate reductase n=1 Tax=Nocardioides jejuensis TaxID=2502782 RepID=A0A4R1CG15_9ACTN|nr:dihydrofolate reductase [Nocardioides jejuensis]TCJ28996.1 dihydrofolate reductase [Nocardioides jejuensis]